MVSLHRDNANVPVGSPRTPTLRRERLCGQLLPQPADVRPRPTRPARALAPVLDRAKQPLDLGTKPCNTGRGAGRQAVEQLERLIEPAPEVGVDEARLERVPRQREARRLLP